MRKLMISAVVLIAGCASSSITPISRNQFVLDASAAPVCGSSGAAKVATQMAAIETLRSGFDGYAVVGLDTQNNVNVVNRPPTGATTTSTFTGYGNSVYGNSTTTFTGGGPLVFGTHDQRLVVKMFKKNEAGFANAVDARKQLGEDWREDLEKGISTCS